MHNKFLFLLLLPLTAFADNPICDGRQPFADGTLWKPKGEHTGNLTVLIQPQFDEKFDSCRARLKRKNLGRRKRFERLKHTGLCCGDRQVWRGRRPGKRYFNSSCVVCRDGKNRCRFCFKGRSSKRHE